MKEIKFRAWNGKVFNYNSLNKNFEGYLKEFRDEIVKYQLFTGLKDKNGKEIYEGDVLKIKYYKGRKRAFRIEEVTYEKFEFEEYGDCIGFLAYNSKNIEIIGNKFENPKLLK